MTISTITTTLGIDFGAKHIGLALVQWDGHQNQVLFGGVVHYDHAKLKEFTEPRAKLRHGRRSRKVKQARLRKLGEAFRAQHLNPESVASILRFCRRRGQKWLYGEKPEPGPEADNEQIRYEVSREEFFDSLSTLLRHELPGAQYQGVLTICQRILNADGERHKELRPIRIDNRGRSRCGWEGCGRVPPRTKNALEDPLRQALVTMLQGALRADPGGKGEQQARVAARRLANLTMQHIQTKPSTPERRNCLNKIKETIQNLHPLYDAKDHPDPAKAWRDITKNLKAQVKLKAAPAGRNRFCREHAEEYVRAVLKGTPPVFRQTLTAADLISRREQILFAKLWAYISARILPLASQGIDRLVVERTAFDLLGGLFADKNKLSSAAQEALYQQGPRYGFDTPKAMLREEFGGRCAYCGSVVNNLLEVEHLLPRANWFFDSYLNVLPSCRPCNARKGTATPLQAGLTIHAEAYQAYSDYCSDRKRNRTAHVFHDIKKGLLNLMMNPDRHWEAERYMQMIGQNLTTVVQSQRGPRPLARYLYTQLDNQTGKSPTIVFTNGRETSLLRTIAYPTFDKAREKAEFGPVNHAVDAIVLASHWPGRGVFEQRGLPWHHLHTWVQTVEQWAAPPNEQGYPYVQRGSKTVPGFDTIHPGSIVETDLALFNWNRRDRHTQKQNAYRITHDKPVQRMAAASVYQDLEEAGDDPGKINKIIQRIQHRVLRHTLEKSQAGPKLAQDLTAWLRLTLSKSLPHSIFSSHPADQMRKRELEQFASGELESIPAIIGIAMENSGAEGTIELSRVVTNSRKALHKHHFAAHPANAGGIVAYEMNQDGTVNREKPQFFQIRQNGSFIPKHGGWVRPTEGPLAGREYGTLPIPKDQWEQALHAYLKQGGVHEYVRVQAGMVVVYAGQTERFLRNFFREPGGFSMGMLKQVVGTRRSPLAKSLCLPIVLTEDG